MQFAQIKDRKVINIIVLDDESLVPLFKEGFDHLVRIDHLEPVPHIGWHFDGYIFMPEELRLK